MIRLGVDLGTTYSLASFVNTQGVATLVPDTGSGNEFRTPSVVHVDGGAALVGKAVESLLLDEPGLPIARGFKAAMGSGRTVLTDAAGRTWSSEGLSAVVLRKLLGDLEAAESETPESVVIAVPANFSESQRVATKAAAQLAGIARISLIDEPVAAAQFYGVSEKSPEQTILVYDFGGGTFDATVLQVSDGKLYPLATDGHNDLGGRRIDALVADLIAAEYRRMHGRDPGQDDATRELLRRSGEEIKLALTAGGRAQVRKTLLLGGRALDFALTRDQFEQLAAPIVEETLATCRRCLLAAGLGWNMIDRLFLTGGSAQMPLVLRRLAAESGRRIDELQARQPYFAVAYGAAMAAELRAEAGDAMPLNPVAPYHLGLRVRDPETGKACLQPIIKRNTPLPAKQTSTFYTTRPEQTRIILDIVQSKDGVDVIDSLGVFAFGPIRKPRKNYPIEVTLGYDAEGMVRVHARDPATGEALQHDIVHAGEASGLNLGEQRQMLGALRIHG